MIPIRLFCLRFIRSVGLALWALALSAPALAVDTGAAAPALALPDAKGQTVSLAPGKIHYVDFWAAWCAPCRHSFPWMNAMVEKYKDKGFEVVAVNVDTERTEAEDFLQQTPAQFTVVFDPDGSAPAAWGVKGMPTSVLVGRDGKVLFQHIGFNDRSKDDLEAEIKQAVEAAP